MVKKQDREILYNIINSLLAGALVFLGSFSDGDITAKGVGLAITASLIVAITKFKDYWSTQENEYVRKLGAFVG